MMNIDLDALGRLPKKERDKAARKIVAALAARGATAEELEELQRLLGQLNSNLAQRLRPN